MAWSKEDVTYWKHTTGNTTSRTFAKFKNTETTTYYLCTMQAYLGVAADGTTYTAGTSVTGTGAAVNVTAKCGSSTATVEVSKTVGRSNGSSGYYPKYSDCSTLYTFVFSKPIQVDANAEVSITLSIDDEEPTTVMVCKNENPAGRATNSYVKINTTGDSTGWKKAIAWVNIDGTVNGWRPTYVHINTTGDSTGWEKTRD